MTFSSKFKDQRRRTEWSASSAWKLLKLYIIKFEGIEATRSSYNSSHMCDNKTDIRNNLFHIQRDAQSLYISFIEILEKE